MITNKNPYTYEWERDVYVKIPQGDKLLAQAKIAKWMGHSSQSDGHCIYWPDSQMVTVERNIHFDLAKEPSLAPILPNHNLKESVKDSRKRPIILQPEFKSSCNHKTALKSTSIGLQQDT